MIGTLFFFVIPGRPEGPDPEFIASAFDYGFRVRGLAAAPRNDDGRFGAQ
jgi:hypothetical protein